MDKDERIEMVQVDPDKITCKTCEYKNQGQQYPHYTKGNCGIYPEGIDFKPKAVLFEGARCEYYKRER